MFLLLLFIARRQIDFFARSPTRPGCCSAARSSGAFDHRGHGRVRLVGTADAASAGDVAGGPTSIFVANSLVRSMGAIIIRHLPSHPHHQPIAIKACTHRRSRAIRMTDAR
ncbi:MAG: hypothetical protein ACLSVD_08825 [Eggerthellaceae bacterium]